jgi:hypothetical protein
VKNYVNARRSPQDIASGLMLAPGEVTDQVDPDNPHDRGLIDEGVLLPTDAESETPKLAGKALEDRGKELGIEGFSQLSADEKREKVAEAEAALVSEDTTSEEGGQ